MSVTIGKRWHGGPGDRQARCDYCGVYWLRSQLEEDEDGLLACPDEGSGASKGELDRENAEGAAEFMGISERQEKGVPQPADTDVATPLANIIGGVTF